MIRRLSFQRSTLLLVALLLASGASAQKKLPPPPPMPTSFDIKRLGLGKLSTVVIAMESTCKPCFDAVGFYKSLMNLPGMDGTNRRVVVVAMDGVVPVATRTKAQGFEPHGLTSGPYPRLNLPGVKRAPTILVVDGAGKQRGVWAGPLTSEQQKAVIAAATAR